MALYKTITAQVDGVFKEKQATLEEDAEKKVEEILDEEEKKEEEKK